MADVAGNSRSSGRDEVRTVRVDEPQLSERANRLLTEEAREVLGTREVRVPADRPSPSHGGDAPRRRPRLLPWQPKEMIVGLVGAALVVVAVIAGFAAGGSWWLLPVAFLVLLGMAYFVAAMGFQMMSRAERPSPTTVAILEEEGVRDPEELFSDIVAEFTEDTGAQGTNDRTTNVTDDPTKAAAEHESSITPSSGASRPVGP